jgi:Ca2+-transporting ATPase
VADASVPPSSQRDGHRGLSSAEASRRLEDFGPNEVAAVPRVPVWSRVAAQLRDPLIMVLLAALALTVVVAD